MIIPPIKDISTSVQLIGRANGGKKYVNKHNIYIQEEHYIKIKNQNDYALNLINPIEICETDFKTNKEKDMNRWEIPISIDVSKEIFEYIVEKKVNNLLKKEHLNYLKKMTLIFKDINMLSGQILSQIKHIIKIYYHY